MLIRKICILGGSGFVGRVLANRLTAEGYQLSVFTRNRERRKENLILLPTLDLIQADVHDLEQLHKNFTGCDAVINLVGILNERGRHGTGFRHVHVDLVRKMIEACRDTRVRRILHMSALNANARLGPSHYLKTKGEGEDLVHAAAADGIHVTSFRPSVIFGREDSFFNRFANLLKLAPVFPLACPQARFAPVYVGNVAEAFTRALIDPESYGKRYNLCGPQVFTLLELVRYTAKCAGMKRLVIPLPDILSRLQAAVFDFVPGKPFSTDNYLSTKIDSVCDRNDMVILGITPVGVEAVVPQYLGHRFQRVRYNLYRRKSRRNQYS